MYGIKNKPVVAGMAGELHIYKAKRLCIHTAEQLDHAWVSRLGLSRVDFGSGKRTIHTGGRLDTKYSLVVADTSGEQEALTRLREVLGL
ncbi:MAG: type IV toxin-antitoxin system AbiEi family antitoxin domain-containing protein [Haliea sp.]|nr:type IV toxin-antitoxin system AbiEi family antitoxin domain-containing protein [Haliea sp.]